MASNEVRIIGGLWRGRKLRFAATRGLRPTLGRVRETLFNWLAGEIRGARCLDLYAGSGALGLEALSRGAAEVTFVERNRKAAASLSANLAALEVGNARVCVQSAERFLDRCQDRFDIVFFDPPFNDADAWALLCRLRSGEAMTETGVIYIERSAREPLPFAAELTKSSRAGECRFALLPTLARQQGC